LVVVAGVFVPDGWAPVPDLSALAAGGGRFALSLLMTDSLKSIASRE
jgi:hypothetical protein